MQWETTTWYNPPAGTWKTKTIEAFTSKELDTKISTFLSKLPDYVYVQSIQYVGCTNSKQLSAMIVYINPNREVL